LWDRRRKAANGAIPDWPVILGGEYSTVSERIRANASGPKVLIGTSVGGHWAGTSVESLLAVGLALRGAEPQVLLCDRVLPACLLCDHTWFPKVDRFTEFGPTRDLCSTCFDPAREAYEQLGLVVHRYGALLEPTEVERAESLAKSASAAEIAGWREDGIAIGEHAMAGALRFFARADLGGVAAGEAVLRRYFQAALLAAAAMTRLLRTQTFEVAVFHHGIYVPQGLVGEVCRREGVRVVNWNPAYRKQRFIFSHDDTYHHTLMDEPTGLWETMPWDDARDEELMTYLKSRWYGTEDWIWFHDRPQTEKDDIERETGLDFSRPCIGLLTNVMWDAQLHYPANAFPNMLAWVLHTIDWFGRRPDLQLLIRVHPAEIRGTLPSAQPLVAEISRAYPALPLNVSVVGPESRLSTYALMERCDSAIIYGTKTGVELSAMGIPVIVAGEAWIRNKGLTRDARTVGEYDNLLSGLPLGGRLDEATVLRAKRYAYHFFFRRMIPVQAMHPAKGNPPYQVVVSGIRDLEPGACPGLDVICEGILEGKEFVFSAERE